jgi:DNA-binding HxlR family transcriptional regulator
MVIYPQFCALARALELLGERWTLLIVRELLLGSKRFSDLKARLDGISASVLSQRLSRLEEDGLVHRSYLPPPAASTVFELTEQGRGLEPAVFELIRWGGRFLYPVRSEERREPEWVGLVLRAYARKGSVPKRSFNVHLKEGDAEALLNVRGTARGTTVSPEAAAADLTFSCGFETVLGLMSGRVSAEQALETELAGIDGDVAALAEFPEMFELRG